MEYRRGVTAVDHKLEHWRPETQTWERLSVRVLPDVHDRRCDHEVGAVPVPDPGPARPPPPAPAAPPGSSASSARSAPPSPGQYPTLADLLGAGSAPRDHRSRPPGQGPGEPLGGFWAELVAGRDERERVLREMREQLRAGLEQARGAPGAGQLDRDLRRLFRK